MTTLHIQVAVKVRFAFVDWFKFEKFVDIALPTPLPVAFPSKILVNERGVFLKVWA